MSDYVRDTLVFEIHSEHRGSRYASKACMAISEFVSRVSGSVIITVDPDNILSIRTIERIGGEFIDELDVPEHNPHFARGSFRKKRYRWKPIQYNARRRRLQKTKHQIGR